MLRYFFHTEKQDAELKKLTEKAVLKKLRKILPLIDIKELQYENGLMTIQNNPPEELLRESRAITYFNLTDTYTTNDINKTVQEIAKQMHQKLNPQYYGKNPSTHFRDAIFAK